MTHSTMRAVQEYLAVRGQRPTDHVFLYRNQPLSKDLVPARLKIAGERVGVKVYPHRLRHTAGRSLGRLVNASMDATCL